MGRSGWIRVFAASVATALLAPFAPACSSSVSGAGGSGSCDGTSCAAPACCLKTCGGTDVGDKCVFPPDMCTTGYDPVCGCDGVTYGNACRAHAACVGIDRAGPCSPSDDWARCDRNSVCVLASSSCCGTCGRPTVTDVDAVNSSRLATHVDAVCPAPTPCPLCATQMNPDLLASCQTGVCAVIDIRREVASACAADTDCRLRSAGCCECSASTAPSALTAINRERERAYQVFACDPDEPCPACAPIYPDTVEAYCATDAHCAVRPVDCDGSCAAQGLTCCGGLCVGTFNDVNNCGACGHACTGATPFCDGSVCTTPPCAGAICSGTTTCCGDACCGDGQLCCVVPGPGPAAGPICVTPGASGTCPTGCPLCR